MADDLNDIISSIPPADPVDPVDPVDPIQPTDPTDPVEPTDDEKKQNAAFAKMRVENQTLKNEIAELRKTVESFRKPEDPKPADPDPNKELTPMEKRIQELEKKLESTTTAMENEQNQKRTQYIAQQLTTLRDEYSLTPNDLVQFAEDATRAGYNLQENPAAIINIYKALNANKIIEQEIAKKLKENGLAGASPSIGPTGSKTPPGGKKSINSIIEDISKK